MIKCENVSVVYDKKIHALDDFTMDFSKKCTVIIGENGSGKSTLLQAIVGLVPHTGDIYVGDIKVEENHYAMIRKQVGFIFQNPDHQLFMNTIYDDIEFGLRNQGVPEDVRKERVGKIAKQMGVESFINRSASKLSGGQKRLASIASVLVMRPGIILMDEPCSYLDPRARRKVIQLIQNYHHQFIVATHDLDMALEIADEVVLIKDGKKVIQGEPESILTNKELLEEYGLELPYQYRK